MWTVCHSTSSEDNLCEVVLLPRGWSWGWSHIVRLGGRCPLTAQMFVSLFPGKHLGYCSSQLLQESPGGPLDLGATGLGLCPGVGC